MFGCGPAGLSVTGCLGSSASLHSSYCINQTCIYPNFNKTEKFLKLPGPFQQEKGLSVSDRRWDVMCAENLWALGEI